MLWKNLTSCSMHTALSYRSSTRCRAAAPRGRNCPGSLSTWTAGRVRNALGLARAAVARAGPHGSAVHLRVMLGAMLQSVGEFREAGSVLDQAEHDVAFGGDVLWAALPAASKALTWPFRG